MSLTAEDRVAFAAAVTAATEAHAAAAPENGGIGTLSEKTVHAALKRWRDPDETHHEVPLPEGYIADIFDGERVTEIQTAGFSGFRPKLACLLEHYPVTVIHPVIREKTLLRLDPATGEIGRPRRASRKGCFADTAAELVYLLPLLGHPGLTVESVLLDAAEYRIPDGVRRGRAHTRRGERVPTGLVDRVILQKTTDYAALIPAGLPDEFDSAAFARAAGLRGRRLSAALKVLLTVGALTREKQGRGYRYRRTAGEICENAKTEKQPCE